MQPVQFGAAVLLEQSKGKRNLLGAETKEMSQRFDWEIEKMKIDHGWQEDDYHVVILKNSRLVLDGQELDDFARAIIAKSKQILKVWEKPKGFRNNLAVAANPAGPTNSYWNIELAVAKQFANNKATQMDLDA